MERYFVLPATDDPWVTLAAIGVQTGGNRWWQALLTAGSMIVVVNSVLAGVVAGLLWRSVVGPSGPLPLTLAAAAFDACGALRYRQSEERELRKLGRHIHRRTRPGTTDGSGMRSLTERERQVARLVVDRKTNPEIASELFLSQKTVETHLRNIFHKMDLTTRVALARAVERADQTASAQR
jgi:DNA-binding NarL/FixJ family response regulator